MVPDKNRTVFIRTSGGIRPCLLLWTMFFSFCTLWFLFRPCFSLLSPCGFYSDCGFSNCYIKSATVISDLRSVILLWFLFGSRRFSGSVLRGFYKEWGFRFLLSTPRDFYSGSVVLQNIPMMFLLSPCVQSGNIEYVQLQNVSIKNGSHLWRMQNCKKMHASLWKAEVVCTFHLDLWVVFFIDVLVRKHRSGAQNRQLSTCKQWIHNWISFLKFY